MSNTYPVVAAILLFAGGTFVAAQRSASSDEAPDVLLKTVAYRELVDGDLNAAIREYQTIVDRYEQIDKAVAAEALLRMGGAYQRLGNGQARVIYERIVRQFGDQAAATAARAKLLALDEGAASAVSPGRAVMSVSMWSGPNVGIFGGGRVSRDGRWVPYTDWSTGDLALHDLVNGRDRQLTRDGRLLPVAEQQYAGYSRVSPDARHVAFSWFNSQRYEIRMVDLQAQGSPRVRTLYSDPEAEYIHPFDWSPDGTFIVVELRRRDRSGQIALLRIPDSVLLPLTTFEWRDESTNVAFSPDGRYLAYDLPAEEPPGERDVFAIAVDGSRQVQITSHRKNDQLVGWSRDGSHLIFSSDRTGTVQLWAQPVSGLDLRGSPRVIPSDFSGHAVGVSGDTVFDIRTTHSGSPFRTVRFDFDSARAVSTPADPGEELFSINVRAQAEWSPDGRSLVVTRRDRGGPGGVLVSILDLESGRVRHVRPQMNQLGDRVAWHPGGEFLIASGSDLKDRSGLFRIALDSGAATRLFDEEFPWWGGGLSVAPDGTGIYFRRASASTVSLVVKDLQSGAERDLVSLPRPGTPFSDLFMRPSVAPDGRRIATITRSSPAEDTLIVIDVESGRAETLLHARTSGLTVLMWAPDSRSVFVRRTVADAEPEVLRVPVGGGDAVKVNWALGHDSREFRVHPDGRRLVYVLNNVGARSELRALPNVLGGVSPSSP